uniref:Putative isopenicillin-n-synthase n=1 Tax=Thalassocalyce inconstans TaxID=140487 RepID=A0A0A0RVT9_THAIN|nr:putative isopenicillin-n-synthase [Thalassocalyce inconstans]
MAKSVVALTLVLGIFVASTSAFVPTLIEKLWPGQESDGVFDTVARIPYSDLLNDNPYVDPFILHSMKRYGFFYVVDVPEYSALEELEYMQKFFELPEELKSDVEISSHNPENKNAYRGYCPGLDDVDSTLQYKNVFNIGPHEVRAPFTGSLDDALEKLRYECSEPNVWPTTDNCTFDKGFKEVFQVGFELRRNVARAFIRSISRALEMPNLPSLFNEDEFSAMGLRKYPVREQINANMYSDFDGTLLRELEHVDSTVTVLSTFNNDGLEALYKNQYSKAPVTGDNAFLVNIGKLVDDIIDNQLTSVRHRVVEVPYTRYSITYFLGPAFDADISRSMSGKMTEAGHKYRIFGEWIKDYLGAIELFYY